MRWGYAVFGQVIDGMDVIEHISTVPTGAEGRFKADAPLTHVIIQKMEIAQPGGGRGGRTGKQLAPAPTGNEAPLAQLKGEPKAGAAPLAELFVSDPQVSDGNSPRGQ